MAKHRHPNNKSSEDWMNSKWRPAMGWLYMTVCAFDFILFPILWSLYCVIMYLMLWQARIEVLSGIC